jgi:hypothetical protein
METQEIEQETEMERGQQPRLDKETYVLLCEQAEHAREHQESIVVPAAYARPGTWAHVTPPFGFPGLPPGWQLYSAQGAHLGWYYTLTTPDNWVLSSHPEWQSPVTAAAAGLAMARELAAQPDTAGEEQEAGR